MSSYVLIDILIAAAPLSLSFDKRVRYVLRWPAVLITSIIVAVPYVAWDSFMTIRRAWEFSPRFAGNFRLLWLPPGELLFFLVVPFSCIFIFEVVSSYLPRKVARPWQLPWISAGVLLALSAFLFPGRLYTQAVAIASGAFLALSAIVSPSMLASRSFWLALGACYVPFLAANGILTALPVVTYSSWAILGPRAVSIPLEDFFYNFSYLGFTFLVYGFFRSRAGLSILRPFHETRFRRNVSAKERMKTAAKNNRWIGKRSAE
jgi:lycopene cyclase domain-containing protein